jgi:hypothetical protein
VAKRSGGPDYTPGKSLGKVVGARSDLSAEELDAVVRQLNGICRSASLEFALRVGALIIHHFYGGDMEGWRERGPKINSFRRLAEHPELALSAAALYRCVAIFEICERLRAASRWRRLGATHLRVVIGIPSDKQEYLLSQANEECWSVQVLQAKAQSLRAWRPRGGRRVQSLLDKRLRAIARCLQNWSVGGNSIGEQEPEELERSLQLLERMKAAVEELSGELKAQRRRLAEMSDSGCCPAAQ